ncbi:Uncharacterised protein [uncultured archaeon]|nr:Uncharacterised protein [uncultured archaeon]
MDKNQYITGLPMNFPKDVAENKFLLVLISEEQYINLLYGAIKSLFNNVAPRPSKTAIQKKGKICYVCLRRPYKDVLSDLKESGIDTDAFFFIDVLSSHYETPYWKGNCIFLRTPLALSEVHDAISKAIAERNCRTILIDAISNLLNYRETFDIVRFTHNLLNQEKKTRKIFVAFKKDGFPEEEGRMLTKDIMMFADCLLDLGPNA